MFDVTFLGHQGWLIESRATRILVDPLLGPGLGNMPEDGFDVYPPRRIDLESFPPVDAVIATHEHADHLSLPSLLRLDRKIPILLPARISTAAKEIVRELGFLDRELRTSETTYVGDLEIHPFPSGEATRDEWDVRPLLVRDTEGDGSLATSIDAVESQAFAKFALARAERIGLWASTHNHMDLFPVREGGAQEHGREVTLRLVKSLLDQFERNFRERRRPEVLAVLASGFSYKGDLAWMNRHVFPGHPEQIAEGLAPRAGAAVRAPLPGHRFSFSKGSLVDETPSRSFFSTLERSEWPPHAAEPFTGPLPDYEPACGRRQFSKEDLAALLGELRGFAEYLYGRETFRALYAAGDTGADGARVIVGFGVRTPTETLTLAYRPEARAFELVPYADAHETLIAGLASWASDLLAALRFDLFSGYMLVGRYRKWNRASDWLRCDLDADLALYTHPLCHPGRTLALYRRTVAKLAGNVGSVRVSASPKSLDER